MRFLVLLISLIPCVVFSQVNIDFESGAIDQWMFSADARWGLDDLSPISGTYSLKHIYDNSEAGTDIAFIPLVGLKMDQEKVVWKFKIRHGYNPSSSNRWAVILSTNQEPDPGIAGGIINGLVLGVNISGYNDTLSLWRLSDGDADIIARTSLNWQIDIGTEEGPELIIERDPGGIWSIYLRQEDDSPILIGSGNDDYDLESEYFGVYYSYTSSCDQLLWIDDIDIRGYFEEDLESPNISGAEFISSRTIQVKFNESLQADLFSTENFSVVPSGKNPDNIKLNNSQTINLEYYDSFQNKTTYKLIATDICDISGNYADSLVYNLLLVYPEWGDLVITEIMPDPDPSVDLPESEYIEIYNRSLFPINLRSVFMQNGSKISEFPDYQVEPAMYITVCDENDTLIFGNDYPCVGIRSMPSLNNNSDYILLCDTLTGAVHGLEYHEGWFNNHFKNAGGWALEMIDPDFPFAGLSNWTYSISERGGTPGYQNAVNRINSDLCEPQIKNCFTLSQELVKVDFSEPVVDFSLYPGRVQIGGIDAEEIIKTDSLRRSYEIRPGDKLRAGEVYTLDFINILDYGGNRLNPSFCQTGLIQKPLSGDIIINEVLFDAFPGEPEFIEFYNRSDRIIGASGLLLTCINTQSGDTGTITYLSPEPRCILPGDYYVITEDKNSLQERYFSSDPGRIFELNNLTTLPDNRGRLLLMSKDLTMIDDFTYYEGIHMDNISETAGVSLERISPEISSNIRSNWHSATGLSGWGTPGLENSVFMCTDFSTESSLSLSSSKITPDNDGYEDYLVINLNMGEGEWLVDIIIYDDQGYRINYLCKKMSASGSDMIIWHGTDGNERLLPTGIYIVFVKAVSSTGKINKWKKVCSVLRR